MPATNTSKFEAKIARERRAAARTAIFRDAANDAPRCPWIYTGFEESPPLRKRRAGTIDAGDIEQRLRAIDRAIIGARRVRDDV